MPIMDTLLPDVEAFIAAHNLADSAFGELALRDRHFVRQLRDGRETRRATVEKVRTFMAEYEPQKVAA